MMLKRGMLPSKTLLCIKHAPLPSVRLPSAWRGLRPERVTTQQSDTNAALYPSQHSSGATSESSSSVPDAVPVVVDASSYESEVPEISSQMVEDATAEYRTQDAASLADDVTFEASPLDVIPAASATPFEQAELDNTAFPPPPADPPAPSSSWRTTLAEPEVQHPTIATPEFTASISQETSDLAAPGEEAEHTEIITVLETVSVGSTETPKLSSPEVSIPILEEKIADRKQEDMFASQELVEELREPGQMGQRGEAWVLAQVAALLLVIFPPIAMIGLVDLMGTLAITAGTGFILYALLSLGRNFSPMAQPRRTHTLVTSGMYSHARHPMYAGLVMIAFGMAAVTLSEARLAFAALLWFILEQKAAFEEAALSKLYPEYKSYTQSTAKFIPYVY